MIYDSFSRKFTMNYFVPIGVIKDRTTKMYPKYFNGKLWPYHLSCFINSFLYDPTSKTWLFEKLIFELEAFYSFKITCILVRQVIPLKKSWWFYQNLLFSFMASYLYSFNPSISINENGKYRIVENVCNIVLFLVATDWFSPIIVSKVFCIWFLRIAV